MSEKIVAGNLDEVISKNAEICDEMREKTLMALIKENFDNTFSDLAGRFRELGLDDNLVMPSYVVNVGSLQAKIQEKIKQDPELNYNHENERFLENIVREVNLVMREENA